MKKMLSVLLALMMLFCCCSALAEAGESADAEEREIVPAFHLITVIPEGYEETSIEWLDPFIVTQILKPTAEGKPSVMTIVSYNDAFSDITFNDEMSDEDFNAQVESLVVDEETGEKFPYTVQKTGLGTRVVLISYPEGNMEFYSIWHGYEVSLHCANFELVNDEYVATPPTEEQIAVIMQFLTDMDFQKVIEEVEEPAA